MQKGLRLLVWSGPYDKSKGHRKLELMRKSKAECRKHVFTPMDMSGLEKYFSINMSTCRAKLAESGAKVEEERGQIGMNTETKSMSSVSCTKYL